MSGKQKTPWFALNSPEIGRPFQDLFNRCREEGVLDCKTKELLMLAIASVCHCPDCTEEYIERAIEAGASREEVTEVLLLAAVTAARTQLALKQNTYVKYLGHSKEKGEVHAAVE